MQVASMHFKERAHVKLNDAVLQGNLDKIKGKFVAMRHEVRKVRSEERRAGEECSERRRCRWAALD